MYLRSSEQLKRCFSPRRIWYFYTTLAWCLTWVHARINILLKNVRLSWYSLISWRLSLFLRNVRLPWNSFVRISHLFRRWKAWGRLLLLSTISLIFFISIAFWIWWLLNLTTKLIQIFLLKCLSLEATTYTQPAVWTSYLNFGTSWLSWVIFSTKNIKRSFATRRLSNFNVG